MPAITTVSDFDLSLSPQGQSATAAMLEFMREVVLPAEGDFYSTPADISSLSRTAPVVMNRLKEEARERGLWNAFLPSESGLSQVDYARLAELSGWSLDLAPEAMNCQAPDSGNMELLHLVGDVAQQRRWLDPLLMGSIRSCFAMTEPDVASSDATSIDSRLAFDGDDVVITGRKWWASGAAGDQCEVFIAMARSSTEGPKHEQHTLVLVPRGTPGLNVLRDLPVFGHHDHQGHCEIEFDNVRVPRANVLGEVGGAFAAVQARLGPGRIHHCMRAIGAAERALSLAVDRVSNRVASGTALSENAVVRQMIAECRIEIEQARLLTVAAAREIDRAGNRSAARLVSMAKVAVPRAAIHVIDRAIQLHGAAGVSGDVPLAAMWGWHRAMQIFDGPDEVHLASIGRAELGMLDASKRMGRVLDKDGKSRE